MTINVVYLEDIKKYVVEFLQGYGSGTYKVNDSIFTLKSNETLNVECDFIPSIYSITETEIVSHYVCGENLKLTVEDYLSDRKNLLSKKHEDSYGAIVWDSIEDENNYSEFIEKWTPVKKVIQQETPIKYTIVNTVIKTNNNYIDTCYSLSNEKSSFAMYRRKEALSNIMKEFCLNAGLKEVVYSTFNSPRTNEFCIDYKDGIRYAKIQSDYLTSEYKNVSDVYKGELSDIIKMYEKDKTDVENLCKTAIVKIRGNSIDSGSINKMIDLVDTAIRNCSEVKSFQKTQGAKKRLWNNLQDLKKTLEIASANAFDTTKE